MIRSGCEWHVQGDMNLSEGWADMFDIIFLYVELFEVEATVSPSTSSGAEFRYANRSTRS